MIERWTAVYWRYGGRFEEAHESFEDCVMSLNQGEENGDLSSDSIIAPDGSVAWDRGPDRSRYFFQLYESMFTEDGEPIHEGQAVRVETREERLLEP